MTRFVRSFAARPMNFLVLLLLILTLLFLGLLAAGVSAYRIYRGILQSFRIPQRKGYFLSMVSEALEKTASDFNLLYIILHVFALTYKPHSE